MTKKVSDYTQKAVTFLMKATRKKYKKFHQKTHSTCGVLFMYRQPPPPTSTTVGSALCHPSIFSFTYVSLTPAWTSGERTSGEVFRKKQNISCIAVV